MSDTPRTVFVITACDFGDFSVKAVFASKAAAEAQVAKYEATDKRSRAAGHFRCFDYDIVEEIVQ